MPAKEPPPQEQPDASPAHAKERLLDAAEPLFADLGFERTSVRDITTAAGCNVAAVNYHFGSKEELYRAVFTRRLETLRDHRIRRVESVQRERGDALVLEDVLRTFVEAFLEPLVDLSRGRVTVQLMVHELLDPHLPPGALMREMIGPVRATLSRALVATTPGLAQEDALLAVHSTVGQVVHALQLARIRRGEGDLTADLERMTEHIVRFSAAGIRGLAHRERGRP